MMNKIKILPLILFSFFGVNILVANAYLASSTNYRMETDVVFFGGGLSTSTNFRMQDALTDKPIGVMSNTNYSTNNGPIPMLYSSISITYPASVTLSPAISSIKGGQGNGEAVVKVTTDNTGGYSLLMKSATDPALKATTGSFGNYYPASVGTPDFTWSVGAGESKFGFSPEGAHILVKYKDNGAVCNTGAGDTVGSCWDSVDTTNKIISRSYLNNQPLGTDTKVKLRAEAGTTKKQPAGSYSSEITFTALAL
ncbi:MAG: hypothetical protein WCO84_05095 [bacterium]